MTHITKVNYITCRCSPTPGSIYRNPEKRTVTAECPVHGPVDGNTDQLVLGLWRRPVLISPEPVTYLCNRGIICSYTYCFKTGCQQFTDCSGLHCSEWCPTTTPTPTPTPVPYDRITLSPGWNFVSTPKLLASGYNTGAIFSNVDMGGRSAWIWDGSKTPPQWVPVISTTPVQPLYGIWIYSVSNTVVNLNFDTNLNSPPTRSLPAGWNSIGFTGVTQQPARNTYLSVKPNWTTLDGVQCSHAEI